MHLLRTRFRTSLLFMTGLLCGGGAAYAEPPCSLKTPEYCRNTNQLVWSPGFADAVRHFIGEESKSSRVLADNALSALGGPPDAPVEMLGWHSGGWLFSACKAHECLVKGALLLNFDYSLRGIAFFDFSAENFKNPRLNLILKNPKDENARNLFVAWAHWTIARDLFTFPDTSPMSHITDLKIIPSHDTK